MKAIVCLFAALLLGTVALAQEFAALHLQGEVVRITVEESTVVTPELESTFSIRYFDVVTRRVQAADGSEFVTTLRLTCGSQLTAACDALRVGDHVSVLAEFPLEPVTFDRPTTPPHIVYLEVLDA